MDTVPPVVLRLRWDSAKQTCTLYFFTPPNQILQALSWVAAHVECAVKGDVHRARQANQFASANEVNVSDRREAAENHTIRTQFFGQADVFLHDLQFLRVVKEITTARADDDLEPDLQSSPRHLDAARAGGRAAFQQIVAKLNTVSPAPLGGKGPGCRIHANLDFRHRLHVTVNPPLPIDKELVWRARCFFLSPRRWQA